MNLRDLGWFVLTLVGVALVAAALIVSYVWFGTAGDWWAP